MKFFLWLTCFVAMACSFAADAMAAPPKKILVVTTTLGYRHASIETAERVLASLGQSSGAYEVELAAVTPVEGTAPAAYAEQVRAMLERKLNTASLKRYDGVVFASTTGELPLPDKAAVIQWVRDGGAFIGIHSASDTLHAYRPYLDMLGGEFDYHREQVRIDAINRDAAHPANRHLPATWNLDGQLEEIYVFKNYDSARVHELLVLDRHPNTGAPGNFPISWARAEGKGRVFYTALGHNEAVWRMPVFQRHVLGGIEWALRLEDGDAHAELPPRLPIDSVPMADSTSAPEVKLDLPITPGPFKPTWASIEQQYPGTPSWLRDAKFGIWVHFGPQAAGMSGDWYARRMYAPGTPAYDNHLKAKGHPSVAGYKEVLRDWNPSKLDPARLTAIYKEAGARFLIVQGVHHDNFDLWNSRHHPWNSTRMGARRDFVGEWSQAAKAAGMRYGVAFHHEYSWWWWQTAFGSDAQGEFKGVPYDGHLTLADGKGTWWEGLDPSLLYGIDLREYKGVTAAAHSLWNPPPAGLFHRHGDYAKWYATQWARRIMDVVEHYDPDFIYTDGTGPQPFSGTHTGTGIKADATQRVIADFYNQTLKRRGKVDTFSIIKFRPTTNGTVNTEEGTIPAGIKSDQAWIAETPVGDWYYAPHFTYDSGGVIRYILEQVARDGNAAISVSPLPDGSLDEGSTRMLKEIGAWMRINGQGIYGSKAWRVLGEGEGGKLRVLPGHALGKNQADFQFGPKDFRFTVGKDGSLYAFAMAVPAPGSEIRISSLGAAANLLGKPVTAVSLLGHQGAPLRWRQEADALVINAPAEMPFATAVAFNIR